MKRTLLAGMVLTACCIYAEVLTVDGKDRYKTIQAAVNAAKPGDTVLVMPGRYPELVTLKNSGLPGKPIIIKAAEKRKAVIDGSAPVQNWKKAGSAAEAQNAANWQNIYYAELGKSASWSNANLYEDGKLCSVAQDPVPRDPFYYDDKEVFVKVDPLNYSATHITLPSYFKQKDGKYWDEAILLLWSANNNMMTPNVESYDPVTGTLKFAKTPWPRPDRDRFSMLNHVDLIKKPGDYVVKSNPEDGKKYVYLWPFDPADLDAGKVTASVRTVGIDINGKSHVEIRDFSIIGFSNSGIRNGTGQTASHVLIAGNEVAYCRRPTEWTINGTSLNDSVIEDNYVHDTGRGIGISGVSSKNPAVNAIIRNNRVSHCGSTGICFFRVHGGRMTGNLIHDNRGHHGNGLTAYLGCKDIVMEGNTVMRSNFAITAQQGENFRIENNILVGNSPDAKLLVAVYDNVKNFVFRNNTLFDAMTAFHLLKNAEGFVIENNILPGLNIWTEQKIEGGLVMKNNIITRETSRVRDNLYRKDNVYELDLSKIFVNAAQGDFTRVPGSPLPEAGAKGRKIDLFPDK